MLFIVKFYNSNLCLAFQFLGIVDTLKVIISLIRAIVNILQYKVAMYKIFSSIFLPANDRRIFDISSSGIH